MSEVKFYWFVSNWKDADVESRVYYVFDTEESAVAALAMCGYGYFAGIVTPDAKWYRYVYRIDPATMKMKKFNVLSTKNDGLFPTEDNLGNCEKLKTGIAKLQA